MTQPRATKRRTTLEKRREEVFALIVEGKTDREIAAALDVNRSSVWRFYDRHQDEIDALNLEVERQVTDYAIASKVARIADAQLRRDLLDKVREARAKGETGYDTGIVVRQYKQIGTGEHAQLVEEYKVDTAFLAEWRANDAYVAEQLGQVQQAPKGGDTYNIDKAVLVRYVEGPS